MLHYFAICSRCSTPEQPEFREIEEDDRTLTCFKCGHILLKSDSGIVTCGNLVKRVSFEDKEVFLEELDD